MKTKKLNHGCTRMHTDFGVKVDVHFKEGNAKMIRTFRGTFEISNGTTLSRAAATMIQDLETQPNYPEHPTRLVVSVYPKKTAEKKHPCSSVSIRGSENGGES